MREHVEIPAQLVRRVDRHRARRRLSRGAVIVEALSLWCELEQLGPQGRDREDRRPEEGRADGRPQARAAGRAPARPQAAHRTPSDAPCRPAAPERTPEASGGFSRAATAPAGAESSPPPLLIDSPASGPDAEGVGSHPR